jgi:tetratricopeptide (TPR) repeat protein
MRKIALLMVAAAIGLQQAGAQSLADGLKMLNYDRYTSAKNIFEKLAANPADIDATYWLGQTLLRQSAFNKAKKDEAKALYQKALQANPNAWMIVVGMGQIDLLEGQNDAAKNKFETALNNTKNKKGNDPKILNAVGRANAEGNSNIGDPAYGIMRLQEASALTPTDPDVLNNLAKCFIKQTTGDGGNAVKTWNDAVVRDPKYARAAYQIGKIYLSQRNTDVYLQKFNEAITIDPAFAPAYLELFDHYQQRDIEKAKAYLDKYMANTDVTCQTKYISADYRFRAGQYQESINQAKTFEAECIKELPRLYLLYAYNHDRLGDTTNSKANFDKFFAAEDPAKILVDDYVFAAKVYNRFNDPQTFTMFEKAIAADTSLKSKINWCDSAARTAQRAGNMPMYLKFMNQKISLRKPPSKADFFNTGMAYKGMKDFVMADSMMAMYEVQYPGDLTPLRQRVSIAELQDTTQTIGTAYPHWIKLLNAFKVSPDSVKYKPNMVELCAKLAAYENNVKKNKQAAIGWFEQAAQIDPANADVKKYLEALRKQPAAPAPKQPAPKPATGKGKGSKGK